MDLKKGITKLLKEKGMYEPTDETLIDELVFNMAMVKAARMDILDRGIILNKGDKNSLYDRVNKSCELYDKSLRNATSLFIKLGINPQERAKLKIVAEDTDDEFSKAFK